MTVWDYLDRHEVIGTFVVLVLALIAGQSVGSVLIAWANAWARRGGGCKS